MKTIKTLKQALKLSKTQLTASNVLNGNIYTVKGWEKFKISEDLKKSLALQISEVLGGREVTKNKVYNNLRFGGVSHWGLDRILITKRRLSTDKRKFKICVNYCAGQDYVAECNEIRTDLK